MQMYSCDEAVEKMARAFKGYIKIRNSDNTRRPIDINKPRTLDNWTFLFRQVLSHIDEAKQTKRR